MKKSLLIFSAFLCIGYVSSKADDSTLTQAVFDFTSGEAIKDANVNNVEVNPDGRVDISGKQFVIGPITLEFDKPSSSYSFPEWSKASEVWVYYNTYMTVTSAGDNCYIKRVIFDATQWPYIYNDDVTATPSMANGFNMSDSDYSFTAVDASQYTSVKFDFFDRGKFNKITVEYTQDNSSVDVIETDNAEQAVYYNMQGRRVDAAQLAAGVYILQRGSKVTKVVVK